MKRIKKALNAMFTLDQPTNDLLDQFVEAKLAKSKSECVRDAIAFYETKVQIDALLTDFVQMHDPAQYESFFNKIKELMHRV